MFKLRSDGEPFASPVGDADGDGVATHLPGGDGEFLSYHGFIAMFTSPNGSGVEYAAEADLDRSGHIDQADYNLVALGAGKAGGRGVQSTEQNIIGYAGYVWENSIGMYLARHRWYEPYEGRWVSRDPLGYVDWGEPVPVRDGRPAPASCDPECQQDWRRRVPRNSRRG